MKKKHLTLFLILIILITFIPQRAMAKKFTNPELKNIDIDGVNSKLKPLNQEIKVWTSYFIAFTVTLSIGILIFHLVRLGASYNHPLHRRKIFGDIGIVLLGVAMLGSIGLIINLIMNFAS